MNNLMSKNKYEIEYVDIDGKTILLPEKFRLIKECVSVIKKLRKEEFIKVAQIICDKGFYIYRFARNYE